MKFWLAIKKERGERPLSSTAIRQKKCNTLVLCQLLFHSLGWHNKARQQKETTAAFMEQVFLLCYVVVVVLLCCVSLGEDSNSHLCTYTQVNTHTHLQAGKYSSAYIHVRTYFLLFPGRLNEKKMTKLFFNHSNDVGRPRQRRRRRNPFYFLNEKTLPSMKVWQHQQTLTYPSIRTDTN